MRRNQSAPSRGFALIAVIVIIAGLIILVTSVLILSGIDRKSSWVQVESYRAELAAAAAIEEASGILKEAGLTDEYFILEAAHLKRVDGEELRQPYTYLALPPESSSSSDYRYVPLFSGQGSSSGPRPAGMTLALPTEPPLPTDSDQIATFRPRPYLPEVQLAWRELKNEQGRTVARYAYWIEDRQRYLNVNEAGNLYGPGGTHLRNGIVPGIPARSLNGAAVMPQSLDQVALFSLDESGPTEDGPGIDIDNRLIADREWLGIEGSSALASLGFPLDGARDAQGRLLVNQARLVEENLDMGLESYFERPMIPYTDDIAAAKRGQPKLNLNQALQGGDRSAEVDRLRDHVEQAFPDFASIRQGGFPDQYVSTLMANALDYADIDNEPSLSDPAIPDLQNPVYPDYRGLDNYPVISEFLIRYRWTDVRAEDGRKIVRMEVSVYAELWNHSNLETQGSYEMSFETQMSASIGADPDVNLGAEDRLDDPSTQHNLVKRNGHYFFPPINVNLGPNEYRVYRMGTINYAIDAGPSSLFVASPLQFQGDNRQSRVLALWNGVPCDGVRVPMERRDATIDLREQDLRCTIPGHSHGSFGNWANNMGDSRIAFYLESPASANSYPANYSPGFRNVRFTASPNATKVYSRVVLSEWPDGGHDAPTLQAALSRNSQIDPMAAVFTNVTPAAPNAEYSPTTLSNRGFFLSATELGNIYDPVLWDQGAGSNTPSAFSDIGSGAVSDSSFGGGNSLRIGRSEHPKFDISGGRAAGLLDLFHAGDPFSNPDQGALVPVQSIPASPNLNTATEEVIRLLVAGALVEDPLLADSQGWDGSNYAPRPRPREISAPSNQKEADVIARAIVNSRPFASWDEVARVRDEDGGLVFGNRLLYSQGSGILWNDRAAEEVFARLVNTSTLRSRNFRIHVIAEALDSSGQISARFERSVNCFVSPGERQADGQIAPAKVKVDFLNEVPR